MALGLLGLLGCSAPSAPPAVDQPPTAEAGADRTVAVGDTVALDGSASTDPEGLPLTYEWQGAEDNPVPFAGARGPRVRFVPQTAGRYRFYLRVSDGVNQSRPDSVAVTASGHLNHPPVADAGPDLVFAGPDVVPLDAGGSRDDDGDSLSYHWQVVSAPVAVALDDSTAPRTHFAAAASGEYRLRLVVGDGRAQSTDEVLILVEAGGNLPPVADAGPDQSAALGAAVTLDGSASADPDRGPGGLSFRWSVGRTPGDPVVLSDSSAARPTFTPAQAGLYVFGLIVDDGSDRSLQDLVQVTVDAPTYPEQAGMIEVPSGPFAMGSELGAEDERPVHQVTLSIYWIDKYEVTAASYQRCVDAGACAPAGQAVGCNAGRSDRQSHPINCITWAQADAYCRWAGNRLPTEAEWEKAARGTDGRRFAWGDQSPNADLLNYDNDVGSTTPVDTYPLGVSFYGLYHMGGNVAEWVGDYYRADYYAVSPLQDPPGPGEGDFRVVRGGSWKIGLLDEVVSATVRNRFNPITSDNTVGVRCARSTAP